ncbi:MAG TPA: hypothetical protein VGH87_08275, partial [Polyangiaceae bacterium]
MRFAFLAVAAFACAALAVSCGSSGNCNFGSNCDGDDGGGGDATVQDGQGANDGGPTFGDTGSKDGGSCGVTCSGDLHNVVDCNNNVVTACPPDEGCAAGACVAACDAAKANKSSVGCDYYAVPATDYTQTCFAVYVANTWGSPVTLTASWGTQNFTSNLSKFAYLPSGSGKNLTYTAITNGQVPVDAVAILFMSGAGCPEAVATATDTSAAGTQVTSAFHITADRPVVLYDIFPYGGGSSAVASATLLLPTSAWDNNYITTAAWSETGFGNPWIAFVAQQDNTTISIVPTNAIVGGTGVAAAAKNTLATYTLNTGQLLRL